MMRAVVVDSATGEILRKITASPAVLGLQSGPGESVFVLVDDAGGHINDAHLRISESGEWETKSSTPEGFQLPISTVEFVAS